MSSAVDVVGSGRPRRRPRLSLEELAAAKGVQPIRSVDDLAADGIFASDEELDEFLVQVRAWRQADLG